jgi:hypothetical protein
VFKLQEAGKLKGHHEVHSSRMVKATGLVKAQEQEMVD